jgi:hypothetical protein
MRPQISSSAPVSRPISRVLAAIFAISLFSLLGHQALCFLLEGRVEGIFWDEFYGDDGLGAVFTFLAVAMSMWLLRLTLRWKSRFEAFSRVPLAVWVLFGFAFYAATMRLAAFAHPYAPDESCAVLMGRALAALRPNPQVAPELVGVTFPRWFQNEFIIFSTQTGNYAPSYWPGYALLMAPLAFFGMEWLLNPLLTALSLGMIFVLTQKLVGSREAGVWALVFTFVSAQIVFHSATYFSMSAHLLFNLVFCWFLVQNTRRSALIAGLVGGFALVLHNPMPHFSFALPWIVWIAWKRRALLGPLLLGYCVLALPLGVGWSLHISSLQPALASSTSSEASGPLGAISQIAWRVAYAFRPPDALLLLARLAGTIKLIVWASPGLLVLAYFGWKTARDEQKTDGNAAYLRLLGASVICNFVIYLFVRFDQGHGWGFRYLHQSWLAFPILAAYFLARRGNEIVVFGASLRRFCAILTALGFLLLVPLRFAQVRSFTEVVFGFRAPLVEGTTITFIKENRPAYTFIQNDPFLRGEKWNLRYDSPAQNEKLARRYLKRARRVETGKWGEIWRGDSWNQS